MKTLAVIANMTKPRAAEVVRRVCAGAARLDLALRFDSETGAGIANARLCEGAALFEGVDAVMALGGDGTMLRVVRAMRGRDLPLIGVNIGALGFLTSVAEAELDEALACLRRDDVTFSRNAMAQCDVGGDDGCGYAALNDVVISSGPSARVITLEVAVDGDSVTSYVCDGLIVATPLGSTGHSLSAGGPILAPSTRAFVLSLICPHTLSSRPLVVTDTSVITVRVAACAGPVRLTVDGQTGCTLDQDSQVRITRSTADVRFIHLPGHSYFRVLRQKLHWRGSSLPPRGV